MLGAVGIIAEYNPFHNGHMFQIELIKRNFPGRPVICVMSGNFVQRGEPAIWNKFTRAKAALLCGADMIVELPVIFATASAEYFAHYALSLLAALGCVEYLCFGSESGELDFLEKAADMLLTESYSFKAELKAGLAKGHSYPLARHNALIHLLPGSSYILDKPNNILGIEYIKAIKRLGSNIKPYAIKREGEGYHSGDYTKFFSSAKAIRAAFRAGQNDPAGIPEILKNYYGEFIAQKDFHDFDRLSTVLGYIVKTRSPQYLAGILDVDEGLHNRICEVFGKEQLISKSLERLKCKRYAYTRLMRSLLHILLDITKEDFEQIYSLGPHYIRVLGFRKESGHLFNKITKSAKIPLIAGLKNYRSNLTDTGRKLIEKEIMSTDIYNLAGLHALPKNAEFSEQIVVVGTSPKHFRV